MPLPLPLPYLVPLPLPLPLVVSASGWEAVGLRTTVAVLVEPVTPRVSETTLNVCHGSIHVVHVRLGARRWVHWGVACQPPAGT